MADVSKVKLPNGTIVNIKDETARANIKTYTLTQDSSDGHKITLTPSSGTGQTITIPDNNTTYTFDTGANNGQIKVTPSGGTAQNVSVKGLGTAAYKAITDTYSSTGTDATSGKAVAAALGTLDGTVSGTAGASKTLTAFSQTDGKVSATFGNISITKSQVSDFPTLGTAAAKNFTTSVTSGSADLVTSGAVATAIDNLPEPMIFKGTLGTGGTITTLPTASASNEGYTYKVITAGTYASQAAKVGDVFVSNGSEWVIIPAGDTDSDTWRAIKVNGTQLLGSAISTGAVNFKNGSNVTVTGSGNDITIAATDTNTTYSLTQDASNGHKITLTPSSGTAQTVTIPDNNTTYTFANGTNGFKVTPSGGTAQTVTVTPDDTTKLPLAGGILTGGLEIKGTIAGDSSNTGHGLYSGGGYHRDYNNLLLHGDSSTGSSGIAFISDKITDSSGTVTNVNQPSDRAFIQYHACGVTTATAEGTAPTIATSGENGRLVIGLGNDATDQLWLQTPSKTGLIHQVGPTSYVIPDTNNTTGNVGSATQPAYVTGGSISPCTHSLNATVPANAVFTDTKNTAGSTDTSSKIFLVGATSQAANPQTYSDNEVYATSGVLTTKSVQVGGGSATLQYNATTQAIDFVFA